MLPMSIQPELIKQSQLIGKLVLDRQSMEEMGRVERVWLDPRSHRIVGITCKSGFIGMKKLDLAWQQIYSLGNNILVNHIADGEEWQKPDVSEQILDWELITDDGNKVGKIEDYLIEPITGEVVSYLFLAIDRGNILTRRFLLPPEGIDNIGNKRVLARKIAVETSPPYTEGLNRLLTEARDFIIEDKDNTLQHVDAVKQRFSDAIQYFKEDTPPKLEQVKEQMTERVQGLAEQTTARVQGFKEQATEKAQVLKGQATEKAQEFKDQATEKVQEFKEQATEKAQVLKGQATEKVHELAELAEQAKGKAQSLADEAQPRINQAIDQAREKAQNLADGAQPMINQAKEKVQAIADGAKKQLERNPELLTTGDESITQTVETTAERVGDRPALVEITKISTPTAEVVIIETPTSPVEAPKSDTSTK